MSLYSCPFCHKPNFSRIGLRQHWCKKKAIPTQISARLTREEWEAAPQQTSANSNPMPKTPPAKPEEPKAEAKRPIQNIQQGRSDIWRIPRASIKLPFQMEGGFALNPRQDFGDIESLAQKIAEHGIVSPLNGGMKGDIFVVSHGERRVAGFDLAVEKGWLALDSPKALIPVILDDRKIDDRTRIIRHVILNDSKPLTPLEQGRACVTLMESYAMEIADLAKAMGCSPTHIQNCLRAIKETAPGVQAAVEAGTLSATTAIELAREVPDKAEQEQILESAIETAAAQGSGRVTEKHISVPLGKSAQSNRRNKKPATPFDGTPATEARTNSDGIFVTEISYQPVTFTEKRVTGEVQLAECEGLYYIGYQIKIPGQPKGLGFKVVAPRLNGPNEKTYKGAHLHGLQLLAAELGFAQPFTGMDLAVEDLSSFIAELGGDISTGSNTPHAPASLPNPVIRDPAKELPGLLKEIGKKDAVKERHETVGKVCQFLAGKIDTVALSKWIIGIE